MAQLIKASGEVITVTLPRKDRLATMQSHVGGYIEFVYARYNGKKTTLVVNEEGLLIGLRPNALASLVAGRLLVGDVLLLTAREAAQC